MWSFFSPVWMHVMCWRQNLEQSVFFNSIKIGKWSAIHSTFCFSELILFFVPYLLIENQTPVDNSAWAETFKSFRSIDNLAWLPFFSSFNEIYLVTLVDIALFPFNAVKLRCCVFFFLYFSIRRNTKFAVTFWCVLFVRALWLSFGCVSFAFVFA